MSSVVTKLPDEPIIIVRLNLPLERNLYAARAAWAECNRQANLSSGSFYAVLDLTDEHPDFADILIWLDERRMTPACQYREPRLNTVVVGHHPMIILGARKIQRQLGVPIEVYATLSDALAGVRQALRDQGSVHARDRF